MSSGWCMTHRAAMNWLWRVIGPGPAAGRYGPGWRQMAQKTEFYVQAHGGGRVFWKAMAKWMKDGRLKSEKVWCLISWHIRHFLCVPTSLCCFLFIFLVCLEIYIELLMFVRYKAEGFDRVEQWQHPWWFLLLLVSLWESMMFIIRPESTVFARPICTWIWFSYWRSRNGRMKPQLRHTGAKVA